MPVWMDLVRTQRFGKKEVVMATIIEFYVPKNCRDQCKGTPQQPGKVIEFCPQAKKSPWPLTALPSLGFALL